MKHVHIYTDGACSGNPGPGGWACVLIYDQYRKQLNGAEADTTNQRMELMAAISALEALKEPCQVDLYSDSAYLINAFNRHWLDNWRQNGWINSKKQPVENQDLWRRLLAVVSLHEINWLKVKGHAGDEINELCDMLAREAIKSFMI
ncbi:MAG: ribonuclease HI [Clostridiales bacterium]|nr:ribonuclease HI [Clostridiales bacterium]